MHDAWQRGEKVFRKLLRQVPGTKSAPRAWFWTLRDWLLEQGFQQSKRDPCEFLLSWEGKTVLAMGVHVDEAQGRGTDEAIAWFQQLLETSEFKTKMKVLEDGEKSEYAGVEYEEKEDGFYMHQDSYLNEKLKEQVLQKHRRRKRDDLLTEQELADMRSVIGTAAWPAYATSPLLQYEVSVASSKCKSEKAKIGDVLRLNKTVRQYQIAEGKPGSGRTRIWTPRIDGTNGFHILAIVDAGEGENDKDVWSKAYGGKYIGITAKNPALGEEGQIAFIECKSAPLSRVTHSSFDAETVAAIETLDLALSVQAVVDELVNGIKPKRSLRLEQNATTWVAAPQTKVRLYSDSKSLCDRVASQQLEAGMSKRRKQDIADLQEAAREGEMDLPVHLEGKKNPVDAGTKPARCTEVTQNLLKELLSTGTLSAAVSERSKADWVRAQRAI